MKTKTFAVTMLLLAAAASVAEAKQDPEDVHVQAILFSGDTITGYMRSDLKTGLKNMFSKSGSIKQWINIGEQPSGGETKRYSASHVREYRFLEPTEDFPEGAMAVSERINSPVPFKPHLATRGFAWVLDRRECGSILKWNVFESTGGRNSVSRIVPAIGVKFKGAKAAYSFMINGRLSFALLLHYLKKQCPEFREVLNQYYNKGKDSKAHRQELLDNPSTILRLYEEYLATHDPISDPEENKDLEPEPESESES